MELFNKPIPEATQARNSRLFFGAMLASIVAICSSYSTQCKKVFLGNEPKISSSEEAHQMSIEEMKSNLDSIAEKLRGFKEESDPIRKFTDLKYNKSVNDLSFIMTALYFKIKNGDNLNELRDVADTLFLTIKLLPDEYWHLFTIQQHAFYDIRSLLDRSKQPEVIGVGLVSVETGLRNCEMAIIALQDNSTGAQVHGEFLDSINWRISSLQKQRERLLARQQEIASLELTQRK